MEVGGSLRSGVWDSRRGRNVDGLRREFAEPIGAVRDPRGRRDGAVLCPPCWRRSSVVCFRAWPGTTNWSNGCKIYLLTSGTVWNHPATAEARTAFATCFQAGSDGLDQVLEWIEECFPHAGKFPIAVLSIDGKTLCGSARASEKACICWRCNGTRVARGWWPKPASMKTNEAQGAAHAAVGDPVERDRGGGRCGILPARLCEQILAAEGEITFSR